MLNQFFGFFLTFNSPSVWYLVFSIVSALAVTLCILFLYLGYAKRKAIKQGKSRELAFSSQLFGWALGHLY